MTQPNSIHWVTSWVNIVVNIEKNISFRDRVMGPKNAEIYFDSGNTEIGIDVAIDDDVLPDFLPVEITYKVINGPDNLKLFRVSSRNQDIFREFYDFLVEVLERIQRDGEDALEAVNGAWSAWGKLLNRQSILSRDKQVGLIGELWCLRRIYEARGLDFALNAWHRKENSEHDFSFEDFDIEAKSTITEDRVHVIGSLMQLESTEPRELFLLSIQLTSAPAHANGSLSLRSMVAEFESFCNSAQKLEQFRNRLSNAGWDANHQVFYESTFVHRSEPRLVLIDDNSPRLVTKLLNHLPEDCRPRIGQVVYRASFDGLGHGESTDFFQQYLPRK